MGRRAMLLQCCPFSPTPLLQHPATPWYCNTLPHQDPVAAAGNTLSESGLIQHPHDTATRCCNRTVQHHHYAATARSSLR
mmetsp:Transcript_17899/g.28560  ORF Transcript_17899/g.28560 Transcript_17899/m.28560 type:complete len:80 (-) Transcript_17899:51-290(-)